MVPQVQKRSNLPEKLGYEQEAIDQADKTKKDTAETLLSVMNEKYKEDFFKKTIIDHDMAHLIRDDSFTREDIYNYSMAIASGTLDTDERSVHIRQYQFRDDPLKALTRQRLKKVRKDAEREVLGRAIYENNTSVIKRSSLLWTLLLAAVGSLGLGVAGYAKYDGHLRTEHVMNVEKMEGYFNSLQKDGRELLRYMVRNGYRLETEPSRVALPEFREWNFTYESNTKYQKKLDKLIEKSRTYTKSHQFYSAVKSLKRFIRKTPKGDETLKANFVILYYLSKMEPFKRYRTRIRQSKLEKMVVGAAEDIVQYYGDDKRMNANLLIAHLVEPLHDFYKRFYKSSRYMTKLTLDKIIKNNDNVAASQLAFVRAMSMVNEEKYPDLAKTQQSTIDALKQIWTPHPHAIDEGLFTNYMGRSAKYSRADYLRASGALGFYYNDIGKHRDAMAYLEKAVEEGNKFAEYEWYPLAKLKLGELYLKFGNLDKAATLLSDVYAHSKQYKEDAATMINSLRELREHSYNTDELKYILHSTS